MLRRATVTPESCQVIGGALCGVVIINILAFSLLTGTEICAPHPKCYISELVLSFEVYISSVP